MREGGKFRRLGGAVAVAVMVLVSTATHAGASGRYVDDNGSVHEGYIEAISEAGIARGCDDGRFCPNSPVLRSQMATFLANALELPPAPRDHFSDDAGNTHEDNINRIAEAGITTGDASGRYNPRNTVTRAQMASFLVRGFDLPAADRDYFNDDNNSVHEDSINRVAQAGITAGDAAGRFNPKAVVTRGQMATFLGRALALEPLGPTITEYLGYDNVSDNYSGGWTQRVTSIDGQSYARAVVNTSRPSNAPAVIDYVLGRDFERFTTTIGFDDNVSDNAETVRVEVIGDGEQLFASDLTYGTSTPIDVDVENVLLLRLAVTELDQGNNRWNQAAFSFAEPAVTGQGPGPVVPPAPGATALGYGEHRSSASSGGWNATRASISGTDYQQAVINTSRPSSTPATIDFVLGRGYTSLRATVGFEDHTNDTEERVQVDVFDETNRLLETLVFTYGQAIGLDVDVTGVLRVRIAVTELNEGENRWNNGAVAFANLRVT